MSSYIELIEKVPEEYKRPISYSESFAKSPMNIKRVESLQLLIDEEHNIINEQPVKQEQPKIKWTWIYIESKFINIVIKLCLHITLISIFESLFFFFYVSSMENAGIYNTLNFFIGSFMSSCTNYTVNEKIYINDILKQLINTTNVITDGNKQYQIRIEHNKLLNIQSWIYVMVFGTCFLLLSLYSHFKKISIQWLHFISEDISFIIILGIYEYMFFNTIILPYIPISGQEIEENVIYKLQNTCGLLNI